MEILHLGSHLWILTDSRLNIYTVIMIVNTNAML